ncbi:MAG: 2OG-Fe(II) oxygenase [Alphaproteobacteria bacterium]|nr:2OG-Fe(II) oxygenase [Alphaproteobacteria bacterium]
MFPLDLSAFEAVPLVGEPFPFVIVPRFVPRQALPAIEHDFPKIARTGSFPLHSLSCGPAFSALIAALEGEAFAEAVARKFGLDLSDRPTMVTVRGQSGQRDGHIHTDSVSKLVTVLLYINSDPESSGGRLRLLRSPDSLDDVAAEVPPDPGTLLVFENRSNAWHGYPPFEGPRRVIQLNWVRDKAVVRWEQTRHRFSAFVKSLGGA